MTGANSIFKGNELLTTGDASGDADAALFAKLELVPMEAGPARVSAQASD